MLEFRTLLTTINGVYILLACWDVKCIENNNLRQKFGTDSFWVNGPYHAIMTAINGPGGEGSYFNFNIFNTNPESSTLANMLPTPQTLIQQSSNQQQLLQTAQQQQLQDSSSFLHSQPALAVLPGQL